MIQPNISTRIPANNFPIYESTLTFLNDIDSVLGNLESRVDNISKKIRTEPPSLPSPSASELFESTVVENVDNFLFTESPVPGYFFWGLQKRLPNLLEIISGITKKASPQIQQFFNDLRSSLTPYDYPHMMLKLLKPTSTLFKNITEFYKEELTFHISIKAHQYCYTSNVIYNIPDPLLTALAIQFATTTNSLQTFKTFEKYIKMYGESVPLCLIINMKGKELVYNNLNIYTLLMVLCGDDTLSGIYNTKDPVHLLRESLMITPNKQEFGFLPFAHSICRLKSPIPQEQFFDENVALRCQFITTQPIPEVGRLLCTDWADDHLNIQKLTTLEDIKEHFFAFLKSPSVEIDQWLRKAIMKVDEVVEVEGIEVSSQVRDFFEVINGFLTQASVSVNMEIVQPIFNSHPFIQHYFNFTFKKSLKRLFCKHHVALLSNLSIPITLSTIRDAVSPSEFYTKLMRTSFPFQAQNKLGCVVGHFVLGDSTSKGVTATARSKTVDLQQTRKISRDNATPIQLSTFQIKITSETFKDLELVTKEETVLKYDLSIIPQSDTSLQKLLSADFNIEKEGTIIKRRILNPPMKKLSILICKTKHKITYESTIDLSHFFVSHVKATYSVKESAKDQNWLKLELDLCQT